MCVCVCCADEGGGGRGGRDAGGRGAAGGGAAAGGGRARRGGRRGRRGRAAPQRAPWHRSRAARHALVSAKAFAAWTYPEQSRYFTSLTSSAYRTPLPAIALPLRAALIDFELLACHCLELR